MTTHANPYRLTGSPAARLLFIVTVAGLVDSLLLLAGTPITPIWPIATLAGTAIVTTSGELLLNQFKVDGLAARLPVALVVGISVTSVAMLIPTLVFGWTAQSAFMAWSAMVIAWIIVRRESRTALPPVPWSDVFTALVWAIVVAFFCRHIAAALPTLTETLVLPSWVDYFAHGTVVASFGAPLAAGGGDLIVPGAPRYFYHYAPFMLPAALGQVTGLPALGLATAVLLPLGLFVGLCGLFGLAAEMGGMGVAFIALGLMLLVPDASHYGLRNGLLGFDWLVFTAPGSAYAIGTAAVAYLCLLKWCRGGGARPLALAVLLTFMLIAIRAHMFLLWAPAMAGTVAWRLLPAPWPWRMVVFGLALASLLTVALVFGWLGQGLLTWTAATRYADALYNNGPEAVAAWVHALGDGWRTLAGGLMALPAALGAWLVAAVLALVLVTRGKRFQAEDLPPVLLCVTYVLLVFWAPMAMNNNVSEYKQRHFVLLYAIVALWTTVRMAEAGGWGTWINRLGPGRGAAAVAVTVVLALTFLHGTDPARPSAALGWASAFFHTRVQPGIPEAAGYLRDHATPGDRMLIGGHGANGALDGPAMQLVALTGIPCHVARIDQMLTTRTPEVVAVVRQRMADQAAVDHAGDRQAAAALLRQRGIRWYIVAAPDMPAWDGSGAAATFHRGEVFVYDTTVLAGA
ncbi:hypothetical protein [Azospirillum sp. B4]|uniref:hypothetical protein n=1 Tax=Azospirillum sp. B4 TaxID=95605 RepID=UPI0003463B77|nr:hypothetical protein [Azospirillum sp. B4]